MRRALPIGLLCALLTAFVAPFCAGQETRPTATATHDTLRVLVLPFESLSGDGETERAVAHAIQRSVELDLSRSRNYQTTSSEKVAPDATGAVEIGKSSDAQFVVRGTVQIVEDRVRIASELVDVAGNESAGAFKVTGSVRDLFELQDAVAEQVRRRLSMTSENDAVAEQIDRAEVPGMQPLRVDRQQIAADWMNPPDAPYNDDVTWRYNYGRPPYVYAPYGFTYGYGYGGFPYVASYRYPYRPYRSVYHRSYGDYTYRGFPDRRSYYGYGPRGRIDFHGPVPLRWLRHR